MWPLVFISFVTRIPQTRGLSSSLIFNSARLSIFSQFRLSSKKGCERQKSLWMKGKEVWACMSHTEGCKNDQMK